MANQARPTTGKEKLFEPAEIADDEIEEIEKIEILQHGSTYNRISMLMEKFASNRMGQLVIEKTDRVLKIIEDTAKWSLPQDESDILPERPLPWIFFLTLIVWLRIFRIWLSVAMLVTGLQPITPRSLVYCIQTQRRRLRAIRVRGLKSMRNCEIKTTVMYKSNKNVTFMEKLRKLFSSAICKPGLHRESSAKCVFAKDGKVVKDVAERSFDKILSDEVVQNLTVSEMLDKYANEDSDDDSDYIPKEDESDDDNNSTSHTSSFSAEDSEEQTEREVQKETLNGQGEEEIKENGETKQTKPKDLNQGFSENNITADKDKEQVHTPKEMSAKAKVNEEVHTPKETLKRKTSRDEAGLANETPVMTAAAVFSFSENNITADKDKEQVHTPKEMSAKAKVNEEVHTPKETLKRKTSRDEAGLANETPVMTAAAVFSFSENNITADKDKEQVHTPKEMSAKAKVNEEVHTPKETLKRKTSRDEAGLANETPVMTAAVAPQTAFSTPKTILNRLVVPDDNKKKSTPGHESAAALKPPSLPIASTEEKSYRTITTQTAIELDWTIIIKTEITHKKHSPKLEKLNYSVNLTPASSTEDVFYSPMGSLQDFHSIFHPGPLINGATGEAKSSTPKESDRYESSTSNETTETTAANNQKKLFNYSTQNKHNNHHNVKNRNKNHC